MSLVLLTLGLLCARPAQAQLAGSPVAGGPVTGGPITPLPDQPVTSGYWVFDHLECQGDDIGGGGRDMGPSWKFPWISNVPTNPYCSAPGDTTPIFDSYGAVDSSSINVAITPFFRWVPGSDPNAAPTILRAKIKSEAYAGDENGDPVSADNGFGDVSSQLPRGYVFYDDSDKASAGTHLEQKDPQGQTLVSLPPQTLAASGGKANDFQSISSEVDYQADTDDRAVTISCPVVDTNANGGSQYRDPALTGPVIVNARMPDGTLRGDTVAPLGDGSVAYTANVVGAWNPVGTTWHWYSSPVSGASLSGDYPNVQVFNDAYLYGAFVGKTEHIFISLYDGNDGAEATANYYMHFHAHYEPSSWPLDQAPYKVMGPDPDAASFATPPPTYPWQAATDQNGNVVPPLIGPQGGNAVITFGGSKTQGGHVDGALGVAKGDVSVQFGGGYDWSKSSDYSVSINPTPALGINQQTWAVSRLSVNRSKGHLDIYGTHGYTGTGLWYKDDIVTTDYSYYQPYAPTNVTPFTPAPGWNPPGYN